MRFSRFVTIIVSIFLSTASGSVLAADNMAAFEFSAESHWDLPFPNDLFTVPNPEMQTLRRINLPLPVDQFLVSENRDTQLVNVLDGFSIFPRITIPLTGSIPDVDTFDSANVYLVALAPEEERGRLIPIDQRVIDDSVIDAPRIIFAPDEYLREQSRYAVVVTNGLTGGGLPYAQSSTFQSFLNRYQSPLGPLGAYEKLLYEALDVLQSELGVAPSDVSTLSVFTTRTVSDLHSKLLGRLDQGDFQINPAQFDIDEQPGFEHFQISEISRINSFVHRASIFSDGTSVANFPPDTLRVESSELQLNIDDVNSIFIQNVRNGLQISVPTDNIDPVSGAITDLDVSLLEPESGDELAALVRVRLKALNRRGFQWNAVDSVAFGSVEVPRYTDQLGLIPPVLTQPGHVPIQTGIDKIVFALYLPVPPTDAPPGGVVWPVVHMLHGGAENSSSFMSGDVLHMAPVLATRGLATVAFSAQEFDGGPRSFLEVVTRNDGIHVIKGTGRSIDLEGDDVYQATELYVYPQRISDLSTIIRSLQLGVDLDGDGASDITDSPQETYVAGVSFGGATAFIAAAVEQNATVFVSNVPSSEGSRARTSGFHPLVASRARSFTQIKLAIREPSLLNGPSPVWLGEFNEDIPLKYQDVQVGLVPGAEAIQRAFDFNMWRGLVNMPLAFAQHAASGTLRGGPAKLLVQLVRGDGAAVNPIQSLMIQAGSLQANTVLIRPDNEPAFDEQWGVFMPPELARHVLAALPYRPLITMFEPGGRVSHFTRVQIAEYLASQGTEVLDPDELGDLFPGDVFHFPVTEADLTEMILDPGLPAN